MKSLIDLCIDCLNRWFILAYYRFVRHYFNDGMNISNNKDCSIKFTRFIGIDIWDCLFAMMVFVGNSFHYFFEGRSLNCYGQINIRLFVLLIFSFPVNYKPVVPLVFVIPVNCCPIFSLQVLFFSLLICFNIQEFIFDLWYSCLQKLISSQRIKFKRPCLIFYFIFWIIELITSFPRFNCAFLKAPIP